MSQPQFWEQVPIAQRRSEDEGSVLHHLSHAQTAGHGGASSQLSSWAVQQYIIGASAGMRPRLVYQEDCSHLAISVAVAVPRHHLAGQLEAD